MNGSYFSSEFQMHNFETGGTLAAFSDFCIPNVQQHIENPLSFVGTTGM